MRKEGDGRLIWRESNVWRKKKETVSKKIDFFLEEAIVFLTLKIIKKKYYWFGKLWEVQNLCSKLSWGQQKVKNFRFYSII